MMAKKKDSGEKAIRDSRRATRRRCAICTETIKGIDRAQDSNAALSHYCSERAQ